MITQTKETPYLSVLNNENEVYSYIDSFKSVFIDKNNDIDIQQVFILFSSSDSKWVNALMRIRNAIVKPFGLKTSDSIEDRQLKLNNLQPEVGKRIGIFKIFDKTENEIILGEDDSHLNFRVSLLLSPLSDRENEKELSVTTVVKFNNLLGKLYFIPVKPFHKVIVKRMTANIVKQIIAKIGQNE